ncbi:hypothetical protein [Asanoa siamensis]|uniref:hypothetical protein n=1 Tax=Asanoa siamensis TaxID=926357 RepID=UPI001945B865|nr:hypothetical protein [Asanoa siamensis]
MTRVAPVTGLKKWQGVITDIEDDVFTAELYPLDHEGPELMADFELRLLAPDDHDAQPGDVVYLTTRIVSDGPRFGVTSLLRRRHTGVWTQRDLDGAFERARSLARLLDDDDS